MYALSRVTLLPLTDAYGSMGREDYTGVTMTIRHPWKSDTWARGSVHSRVAMPWSLGHPVIAYVIEGVYLMRKFT